MDQEQHHYHYNYGDDAPLLCTRTVEQPGRTMFKINPKSAPEARKAACARDTR